MSKLVDFFTNLAVNPIQQERLAAGDTGVVRQAGLSADEENAVLSKDFGSLAEFSRAQLPSDLAAAVYGHRFCTDPGPDPTDDPCPIPE